MFLNLEDIHAGFAKRFVLLDHDGGGRHTQIDRGAYRGEHRLCFSYQ
jgi:hypothetical protein